MLGRIGFAAVAWVTALVAAGIAQAQLTPAFSKNFGPTSIGAGSASTLVYTIDGSAIGVPVTDLAFQDSLPANLAIATPSRIATTCVGATVTGAPGGSTVTLARGRLGAGWSCTVTVDVTSSVPGAYPSISGDLTSSGGNSGTAQDTLTVDASLPGFSLSISPATIPVGALSGLTFTIDNTANASDVGPISFSATLPTGLAIASPANASTDCGTSLLPPTLTAASGTRAISLFANAVLPSNPALTAGAICTVSVDVVSSMASAFDLTTTDLSVNNGQNAGKAVGRLDVERKELQKLFIGDPAMPGEPVQLQYTLTNLDRFDSASAIGFSDDLDAALSGLAVTGPLPAAPCGPGSIVSGMSTVIFAGGSLGPGESCTFSLTLTVPMGAAPDDYLSMSSSAPHVIGGQAGVWDAASDRLRVVDQPFTFTKSFTNSPVGAGGSATIRYSISNESSASTATDIAFTDELAPPFGFPIAFDPLPMDPCGAGSSVAAVSTGTDRQGVGLTAGTQPPDGSCQFDVSFTVPIDMPAGTFELPTAPITGTLAGNPVIGDSATSTLVVVAAPLEFRAEFIDDPVGPLDSVTLEFRLSNVGESGDAITDLAFTDDLEATIAGLAATTLPANGFCGPGSQMTGTTTLSVTGASLMAGQSCVFSVTLAVPGGATPGSFDNATSDMSVTVNGIAVVAPKAESSLVIEGLNFSMQFVDDPVVPGGSVVLEYTIENATAALAASSLTFTHNLNGTLTGLLPSGSLPAMPCGLGSSISGTNILIFTGGDLAPGAFCTFSISLDVPPLAAPNAYAGVTSNLTATLGGPLVFPPANDVLRVAFAPNDACIESTIVADVAALQFADAQDTGLATSDPGDPTPGCGTGADGATVWYSFVAKDNRSIQVSTTGSSYDTVVSVWEGSEAQCGALATEVACNDDVDVGVLTSLAEFDSVAGTSYLIQVGARNAGAGGDLVLAIPEPGGGWLSAAALASLAWLKRRARSRNRESS